MMAVTVVLMSHLGRPKGERNDKYSLRHIVGEVEKVLGKKVIFVEDCVGEVAEKRRSRSSCRLA